MANKNENIKKDNEEDDDKEREFFLHQLDTDFPLSGGEEPDTQIDEDDLLEEDDKDDE